MQFLISDFGLNRSRQIAINARGMIGGFGARAARLFGAVGVRTSSIVLLAFKSGMELWIC